MNTLSGKHVLLGITGSIAAYKCAYLVRMLIKSGAEVRVIMTPSATDFISPLTLSTLSKHEVYTDISDGNTWSNHVELGLWADVMVVAPATANTLAKMAHGIADNMLVASYLSAKCPVLFAPAMDLDMWKHGSTKNNIELLQSFGNTMIPVGDGELASGLVGEGRMAEPEEIVNFISETLQASAALKGKKIVITAGPTYEAIDPVRFIGNRSSGKMGIAIAEACAAHGAEVALILGPSKEKTDHPSVKTIQVTSASDMYEASVEEFKNADAAVMAAAVADYTPVSVSDQKIKKKEGDLQIELKRTQDIAAALGKDKGNRVLVGFALETQNEEANAQKKLEKKNFDFIVLNSLQDKGAGFGHDTNKVKFFRRDGSSVSFPLKSKKLVAMDIVNEIISLLPSEQ